MSRVVVIAAFETPLGSNLRWTEQVEANEIESAVANALELIRSVYPELAPGSLTITLRCNQPE